MDRDHFDELNEGYERDGDIQPILNYIRELDGADDAEGDDSDSRRFRGRLFGLWG